MAEFFTSLSLKAPRLDTTIWAARLVLLTAGIISTAVLFKVFVIPFTFNLLISTLPNCWISFKSWLSPPYIYIIVNFIIITIAASSNFHANQKHPESIPESKTSTTPDTVNEKKTKNQNIQEETWEDMIHQEGKQKAKNQNLQEETWEVMIHQEGKQKAKNQNLQEETWEGMIHQEEEKQYSEPSVVENSMEPSEETSPREIFLTESDESIIEEMLLNQANEFEPVPEDDTLDATWKAIMEGQGKMVRKQLKKSETWDKPPQLVRSRPSKQEDNISPVALAKKELRKSDTFNDSVSLRREKSMTQDELKLRAEAFIRTMKLQRLESEQRLVKMVN